MLENDVSVCLSVYRAEKYIYACINSILAQTFTQFEIVVVEDPSFDRTKSVVDSFRDERIRYFRNERRLGLSRTRNRCVNLSVGKYVFFTDSDCIVSKNWIEQGLKFFSEFNCAGVEGKTYYVCEGYKPALSDRRVENIKGGQFMTCNIAYKKSAIEHVGGFDVRFSYSEDRDLAIRVARLGRIRFNPKMIVYHQKRTFEPMEFVRSGDNIRSTVLFYKKYRLLLANHLWRIIDPMDFFVIVFPILIFGSLFRKRYRYRTKKDSCLIPFRYLFLVYRRLSLWIMCAREKVLLI